MVRLSAFPTTRMPVLFALLKMDVEMRGWYIIEPTDLVQLETVPTIDMLREVVTQASRGKKNPALQKFIKA